MKEIQTFRCKEVKLDNHLDKWDRLRLKMSDLWMPPPLPPFSYIQKITMFLAMMTNHIV